MRQIGLLLAVVVLLALAGAVGINLISTRDALQTQLRLKNSDNAQNIALALSQQHGDAELMNLLLASQSDTGFYRRVRLIGSDGSTAFERETQVSTKTAPEWFVAVLPIESAPGVAQVSDGSAASRSSATWPMRTTSCGVVARALSCCLLRWAWRPWRWPRPVSVASGARSTKPWRKPMRWSRGATC
jgi:hypothetical protein